METSAKKYIEPPSDTPELMHPAWYSCLLWAIGNNDIRKRFEAETGRKFVPPRSPIDSMIDDATGATEGFVFGFVDWFNENTWGKMEDEGEHGNQT